MTLDELKAKGYNISQWKLWQQGECFVYALALIDTFPALNLGVMGETWDGDASQGWSLVHFFAHDDIYAYDSAGRHPLPYLGIENQCDYAELNAVPSDWDDECPNDLFQMAKDHISNSKIALDMSLPTR